MSSASDIIFLNISGGPETSGCCTDRKVERRTSSDGGRIVWTKPREVQVSARDHSATLLRHAAVGDGVCLL